MAHQFLTELEVRTGGTDNPLHLIGDLGALADGDNGGIALLQVDECDITGGYIGLVYCLSTTEGGGRIVALHVGHGIDPVRHVPSDFIDVAEDTYIDVNGVTDAGTELSSGGAGNITLFAADNDYLIIESTSLFDSFQILLDTPASADCQLTWEFRIDSGAWTAFNPVDGTHGMQNSGVVSWNAEDFGSVGALRIRATRTANTLATAPIADLLQIGQGTLTNQYYWDKDGDLKIRNLTFSSITSGLVGPTKGGTGLTSYTLGDTLYASATDTLAKLAGNTANIPKVEVQTGNGSVSAAPVRRAMFSARLASNFGATSTTTLAAITGLQANVEAGKTYGFRYSGWSDGLSSAGSKFGMSGSATATGIRYVVSMISGAGVATPQQTATLGTGLGVTAFASGVTEISGTIVVNAAGTFGPYFAQNVSNGTASTVYGGASFELWEITG